MEIKYRLIDVESLMLRMVQDCFSMILQFKYPNEEWRAIIFNHIEKQVKEEGNTDWYIEAWKHISTKGVESFSASDFDLTAISTLLKFSDKGGNCDKFPFCVSSQIAKAVDNIRCTRNKASHKNGNETVNEMMAWALLVLASLEKLCDAVSKVYIFNQESKEHYTEKYLKEISDLQQLLIADFTSEAVIEKEVQRIMEKKNYSRVDANELFYSYYNTHLKESVPDLIRFLEKAGDAGYIKAYAILGRMYMYGVEEFLSKNYTKSAQYYEKFLATGGNWCRPSDVYDILGLANIYLNNLDNRRNETVSLERVQELLDEAKKWAVFYKRSEIVETKDSWGHTIYKLVRPDNSLCGVNNDNMT